MTRSRVTLPVCCGCGINRREFLAGCAACLAGAGGLGLLPRRAAAAEATAKAKPNVRLVFTYIPSDRPIWPNIGYDFDARKIALTEQLTAACPGLNLQPITVMNQDEAKKMLAEDKDVAGYLVYMLGLWTHAPQVIGAAGKPTMFVDDLYGGSGEYLIAYAAARRAGQKVVGVSTSRIENVAAVARCFEALGKPGAKVDDWFAAAERARKQSYAPAGKLKCTKDKVTAAEPGEVLKRLKASTLLVVGAPNLAMGKAVQEVFGTKVQFLEFKELHAAYEAADQDKAAHWADQWIKAAEKMIEPKRAEIVRSGAMHEGMLALLKKYNAQGITINCLGGFYGGHIKAYPCLGFSQLNDDGLVGGCEADQMSAMTMLTMGYLTGRPGYISDPVIDTSKNQIIYAHCVAPTKLFGPKGQTCPCHIRSHSEDRKGAVLRSLMPLGYMTTTTEFNPIRKEVLFHQAKAVENVDEDKACRSKLAGEVKGDIDKLQTAWDQWGWHRVTVYGDVKEPVRAMAKALGLKVIEEA